MRLSVRCAGAGVGAHARTVEQRSMVWRASVGVAGGSGCAIGEVFRSERKRSRDG